MSYPVHSTRSRVVALASGLALSLSLVAAPAALAQDASPNADTSPAAQVQDEGPVAALERCLGYIEAKDFEALQDCFCDEYADQAAVFDMGALSQGADTLPGMDIEALLDAFQIVVELTSIELVSETETEAVVRISGSMSLSLDAEAMGPFIEAILSASGQDVTPDMVDMMTGMMMAEFEAETTEISDEEITMQRGEDGVWRICDELGVESVGGE